MRRFLVFAFAATATFTVLANNFIPVSAPASVGEFVYRPAGPNDAARLSEMAVYTTSAPVPYVPAKPSVQAVPAIPDLTAFAAHSSSNEPQLPTSVVAFKPTVKMQAFRPSNSFIRQPFADLPASRAAFKPFVEMQAFRPSNTFIRQPFAALPEPTVFTDSLSAISEQHFGMNPRSEFSGERESPTADAGRIEFSFAPLSAGSTDLSASVSKLKYESLPEMPVVELAEFVPQAPRRNTAVSFVNASYQPAEAIFYRPRFAVEPVAPISSEILTAANTHAAPVAALDQSTERDSATADRAVVTPAYVPSMLTALAEVPTAIFDRLRFVPEPDAPVSTETLAVADTHAATNGDAAGAERLNENAAAEPAPKQAYVPSFLNALAEVPSAVFTKIGLEPLPDTPVEAETLASSNADHAATNVSSEFEIQRSTLLPDAATLANDKAPVAITASTAMNADMLKPMSAGPLVDAPLLNENAVASSGYSATPFDRMIDSPDVPEAILKARPVTISGKTEFASDLLKPMNAAMNPFVKLDGAEILSAIQQADNYCDPNFVGPPIRFSQTVELKLDDLLRQLHQRFGVNFIVGKGVADLPMNIKAGSIPWNVLLRSQLFISGVRARCIDANTIELVENQELPRLQDGADVETRFVKLKFLQRTSSGSVDLAGRGQGGGGQNGQGGGCSAGGGGGGLSGGGGGGGGGGQGGGQQSETAAQQSSSKFDKLIIEIEKILGLRSMTESSAGGQGGQGGGQGGQVQTTEAVRTNRFVTQIPGRNILVIRATEEEHQLIDQIIARADRPPFQVVIKGLVYTANQDKLRDIGVSTTITGGTADGRTSGSVVGNTLGAAGTIFDFSTIIGTFDFNVQATALEQSGVLSVKSRPFSTVIDGLCARLNVGRSIPIIIDSSLGGQGALEFIDALNKLDVTPHVIDDENGNPIAVTLELTMFANDVDNSVIARGVPAVSERSIQTQLLLAEDKTAILGGFTVDQASRTVEKTPGIGDIPIIGELFKRRVNDKRVNRLYFAISVDVIPYPEAIRPVDVPGATTDIPSITPEQKKRSDAAEPKQVKGP